MQKQGDKLQEKYLNIEVQNKDCQLNKNFNILVQNSGCKLTKSTEIF